MVIRTGDASEVPAAVAVAVISQWISVFIHCNSVILDKRCNKIVKYIMLPNVIIMTSSAWQLCVIICIVTFM